MSVQFRFATAEDAPACAAIYRPYVEKTSITFEYIPPDGAEIKRRMQTYTPIFPWIVAEEGTKVIGYAYASPQNTREAYQWNADLAIYLHEEARGRGIGRLLYGCLLELLAMQGYCYAIGIVTHPNPGSEALHKSMGFTTMARWDRAGYKLGEWHGVQWFQKQIEPLPAHPLPPKPVTALDTKAVRELFQRYAGQAQRKQGVAEPDGQ
ncbi:MAG: GNAT family N-acetyltransferase [Oscillospiraceae bacterium]|nr:GNAT family N-acetyltransferase [Oscillospiraceae bacterium]